MQKKNIQIGEYTVGISQVIDAFDKIGKGYSEMEKKIKLPKSLLADFEEISKKLALLSNSRPGKNANLKQLEKYRKDIDSIVGRMDEFQKKLSNIKIDDKNIKNYSKETEELNKKLKEQIELRKQYEDKITKGNKVKPTKRVGYLDEKTETFRSSSIEEIRKNGIESKQIIIDKARKLRTQAQTELDRRKGLNYKDPAYGAQQIEQAQSRVANITQIERSLLAIADQMDILVQKEKTIKQEFEQATQAERNFLQQDFSKLPNEVGEVSNELKVLLHTQDQYNAAAQEQEERLQKFNSFKSYIAGIFSIGTAWQQTTRIVRNAVQDFLELDKQFNEIAIVSQYSTQELWKTFGQVNKTAQEYGVTTKNVVEVQNLYYHQGKNINQVNKLTAQTLTLAKITGMDYARATSDLTAALNGYKIAAEDANKVTDSIAALDANAAISSEELMTALTKTASIAANAGMSLQSTEVFLTKMIETTREAPENLGTAMKTIIARFGEVKEEIDGEQIELADINRVDTALKSIGITLLDTAGQIRNLDDVFFELSAKWDSLDRNTQRYIATQAAGSRQQSRFIAMMDDYDRTLELVDIAQNSAGTGARQLQKAQEGLESKINSLKSAWQELYSSVITSSAIGGALNIASNFLNILNTLPGPLGSIVGVLSLYGVKVTVIDKLMKSLGESFAKGTGAMEASRQQMILHISTMSEEQKTLALQNKELSKNTKELIENTTAKEANNSIDTEKKGEKTFKQQWLESWRKGVSKRKDTGGKNNAIVDATVLGGKTAGKAIKKVGTDLKSGVKKIGSSLGELVAPMVEFLGAAWPVVLALAALAGGIAVWKKTLKASLDDTKKVEELSKAQENYNQKLQETNDLKKKAKEYEEYRINGKTRADLTAAQMEEEQSLAKELVDTYPSLLDYIDKEGKYHLKNAEAIQEEIKKKENLANISKNSYLQLRKTYARQGIFTDTSTLAGQAINNLQNFASAFGTEKLNKNSELKRIANKIENAGGESFNKSGFYNIMEAFAKGEKFSLSNEDFSDMFAGDISQGSWEKLLETIEKTGNNIIDETGKVKDDKAFKDALKATGAYSGSNAEKVTNQFISLNKELGGLYGQLLKGAATEQSSIYVEKAQMQVNEFDLQGSISEDLNSAISKSIVATAKGNYTDEEWIQLGDKRDIFIDNTAEQYRVAIEKLNKTQLANLDKMVNEENLLSLTTAEIDKFSGEFESGKTATEMKTAVQDYWNQLPEETKALMPEMGSIITSGSEEVIQVIFNAVKDGIESSNLQNGIKDLIDIYINNKTKFQLDNFTNEQTVTDFLNRLSGAQYKSLTSKLGSLEDSQKVPYLSALIQSYNKKSQGLSSSQQTQLKNTLVGTNFTDVSSVIKQQSALKDLGYTTQEIGQLIIDTSNGVENVIGIDANSIQDTVDSTIKNLTSGLESFTSLLSGNASAEQLNSFLSTMQSYYLQQERINGIDASAQMQALANSIVATSDGFQIASVEGNQYGQTLLDDAKAALALQIGLLKAKLATEGLTDEQKLEINRQIAYLQLVGSQMDAAFKKAQNDGLTDKLSKAKDKADKLVTSLKNLVTWLREYDRYANLDRVIEDWENQKGHLEFEVDFTLNEDVIKKDLEKQLNIINNEIAANQGGIKAAKEDAAMWKSVIQSRNSGYVSFDSNGNAIVDAKKLRQLQEKISKADEYHQESLQAQYDEIMDNVDAYQNAIDKVEDYTSALEDNFKALQDLLNKAYESIKTVEDKLIDVRQDQEDRQLKAVKDKYDAIKEEDNKYLESVRKTIEKERQIRDREDNDNDIRKKERKLAMMKMDTSGVYRNEIQALEEELKGDYRSREDTLIDQRIDEMEEQFSKEQENRDKELTYWDNYYAALRDQRTEYNAWAKQMIESGSDEILAYLKANDQEYLASSEAGKQIWTQQWQQATVAAVAYNGIISTTLNGVQMNLDMCAGSANGFEGAVQSYSSTAIAQNGAVSSTVQDLTGYYQGLAGGVGEVSSKLTDLQNAYTNAANAAERLASAQSRIFGGSFNPDAYNNNNNPSNDPNETGKRISSEIDIGDDFNNRQHTVGNPNRYTRQGTVEQDGVTYTEYLYDNGKGGTEYVYSIGDIPGNHPTLAQGFYRLKNRSGKKYATGGYVDYTGPAWVDGTKAKPEYMLNSTQTAQFEKLVSILDSIFIKTPNYSTRNIPSQETSKEAIFNFNIDVQKMSDDYDVDQLINRIQKKLSEIDKYKKVTFLRKTN